MRRLVPFLVLTSFLAGCDGEELSAALDDPSGFSCRERAAALMDVPFAETSARPVRTNIFGIQTYEATAAGTTFRCILDSDGLITGFSRA